MRERAVVVRRAGDAAELVDLRAGDPRITGARLGSELAAAIASVEAGGEPPLWVWDDTTRWYPALLEAGVRVRRCIDLRLRRQILRRSPAVDQTLLNSAEAGRWDSLEPVSDSGTALFELHEHEAELDVEGELDRQTRAVAAVVDPGARGRLELLLSAESSGALVAAELTHVGLPVRPEVHERLLLETIGARPASPGARPAALESLIPGLRDALDAPGLNPDVPAQVLSALRRAGIDVTDTRSWTLSEIDHPAIAPLLEYKKLARIASANGWRWLDTWVRGGRYRPAYLPGGVITGRWASHGGGALSYPVGLRPAVLADDGWTFVVADVAQLEPRVLAGMSRDLTMAEAAGSSDLYQGMVERRAVASRDDAKLGMLGAMYGATSGESGRLVARLTQLYPRAFGFVEEAARAGERGEVVETFLGRGSPRPGGAWTAALSDLPNDDGEGRQRDRRKWGRFTRNFVVQGTGAEWALCWMATLRNLLWTIGDEAELPVRTEDRPQLVFFLHDEVVVHAPAELATEVVAAVEEAARRATLLMFGSFPVQFPLQVTVARSWAEA